MSKMNLNRRLVIGGAATAVAMPYISMSTRAQAVATFKLHHFLGPQSNGHQKMLVPWAKKVETESGGKIKIDIFPGMQLGGTPPQLYDQVRDGVVDLCWTLPGATPGRFPTTEALELPFMPNSSGKVTSQAAQELFEKYGMDEVKDVKLIAHFTHDSGHIHATKQVKTVDDFKGLKLRTPTRLAGEALKALGATAIGMPVPQVPESLAQKVIDGAVLPWEVVPTVKVHELTKFHTEILGSPAFYVASFFVTMNKAKYDALPADLKAVIDKNSGQAFAAFAGNMWDEEAVRIRKIVAERNPIIQIDQAEKEKWIKATEGVHTAWIEQMKAKNVDGAKLIAEARTLIAKYAKA